MASEKFPNIIKSIENYLTDEEGNITRNKILTIGSLAMILGIIYSMDVYAKHGSHGSHGSHSSHSSTSYIKSHTNHFSHNSHESHSSHVSSTDGLSQHNNSAASNVNPSLSESSFLSEPIIHSDSQLGTITSGVIRETGNAGISIDVDISVIQSLAEVSSDYSTIYNEAYYILANPDVYAAFGNNSIALFQHFLDFGMKEGRIASPEFNVLTYMSYYADLVETFGNDLESYYLHYMNSGKAEGRIGY